MCSEVENLLDNMNSSDFLCNLLNFFYFENYRESKLFISRRKTIVVDILDVVMNISGLAAITAQR